MSMLWDVNDRYEYNDSETRRLLDYDEEESLEPESWREQLPAYFGRSYCDGKREERKRILAHMESIVNSSDLIPWDEFKNEWDAICWYSRFLKSLIEKEA